MKKPNSETLKQLTQSYALLLLLLDLSVTNLYEYAAKVFAVGESKIHSIIEQKF